MSEWETWFFWSEKDEWRVWTRGSLEDVLGDVLDNWPHGVTAVRIERRREA